MVYDIEDGKIVNSQILDTNGEGCGALAGILNIADVDALIAGRLEAISEANCDHHDHHEGHECAHNGKCHE